MNKLKTNQGFTLFIAITVASILALVSIAIANITFRQTVISSSSRGSQLAFAAANSALECVTYWDQKAFYNDASGQPTLLRPFNKDNDETQIECAGKTFTTDSNANEMLIEKNKSTTDDTATTTLTYNTAVDIQCAIATVVTKDGGSGLVTFVDVRGYDKGCSDVEGGERAFERKVTSDAPQQ